MCVDLCLLRLLDPSLPCCLNVNGFTAAKQAWGSYSCYSQGLNLMIYKHAEPAGDAIKTDPACVETYF